MIKNPPANAGGTRDVGSVPALGRSPGEGHGNPLQYSCLENPMDRGAWWVTIHGVEKSRAQMKQFSIVACVSSAKKMPTDSSRTLVEKKKLNLLSVQFSSVAQSCPTLCDPMNRSMPGLPVHHHLPEFTQTHIHRVHDACHPAISSSVIPFSSCPQSLPTSESFPMS